MWLVAVLAGLLVVLTGALPPDAALAVLAQLAPVLVFLVAMTLLAELADLAGVFDAAAYRIARLGGGRVRRLWLLVLALATVTTVLMSLDTTAVLLTPVVLTLCERCGLPSLPFAMVVVWCANTASLLLPVSNLTNLLSLQHTGATTAQFAAVMWAPAVVAVLVTALVLGLRYRTRLGGAYQHPGAALPGDRLLFRVAAAACLLVGPLGFVGVPAPWAASIGAAVVALGFAVRGRGRRLPWTRVPWRLVLLVAGLFLAVAAAQRHGALDLLTSLVGTGHSTLDLLRLAGSSALGANLVNNLPAYAALAPAAASGLRPYALLVGVNLGPVVLLWGSLATLLWHERCRRRGVRVSAREYALVGALGIIPLVAGSTLALLLTP